MVIRLKNQELNPNENLISHGLKKITLMSNHNNS